MVVEKSFLWYGSFCFRDKRKAPRGLHPTLSRGNLGILVRGNLVKRILGIYYANKMGKGTYKCRDEEDGIF